MPGLLRASPADILRWVLIDLDHGTDPVDGSAWPIYVSSEPPNPPAPDSVVTIFNTSGVNTGREMVVGERSEWNGIQVRVRSRTEEEGWSKAQAISIALDQEILDNTVVIGADSYRLHSAMKTTDVLVLGKEVPTGKRNLFTINALLCIRMN